MATNLTTQKPQLEKAGKKRIVTVLVTFTIIYGLMFLAAGSLNWAIAWVFVIISVLNSLLFGIVVSRRNPEIINERGRKSDKTLGQNLWGHFCSDAHSHTGSCRV